MCSQYMAVAVAARGAVIAVVQASADRAAAELGLGLGR